MSLFEFATQVEKYRDKQAFLVPVAAIMSITVEKTRNVMNANIQAAVRVYAAIIYIKKINKNENSINSANFF
ncbi:MAG: hypothetical protein LBB53_03010 [Prevotellaceae bacterium]|jgi:hypothetical protein|nr:hypothetical protein [Prevotellaceae bacterium]